MAASCCNSPHVQNTSLDSCEDRVNFVADTANQEIHFFGTNGESGRLHILEAKIKALDSDDIIHKLKGGSFDFPAFFLCLLTI